MEFIFVLKTDFEFYTFLKKSLNLYFNYLNQNMKQV